MGFVVYLVHWSFASLVQSLLCPFADPLSVFSSYQGSPFSSIFAFLHLILFLYQSERRSSLLSGLVVVFHASRLTFSPRWLLVLSLPPKSGVRFNTQPASVSFLIL